MSGSDYDGQDQASVDLLETVEHLEAENKKLHYELGEIACIIFYQCSMKHQDRWVARMREEGLVTIEGDEEE